MLIKILNVFIEEFNKHQRKGSNIDNKVLEIIEEIGDLEIKLARALADAERFGDLSDISDFRTVEVNRIKRVIESKRNMINILKQNG